MLEVKEKINWTGKTSGMDCLEQCYNKKHFLNYKKEISYQYNSRGFRDLEWPEDLSQVVWCLGDSFTAGIGQPFKETWPQLLQKKIRKRCLNIAEDGCSNDMIKLRVEEIVKKHNPKLIIVMWSYFSRRLLNGKNVQYDNNIKNFNEQADLKNFFLNFDKIDRLPIKILHTIIPNAFWNERMSYIVNKKTNNKLILYKQLDFARDYHHFDLKTSKSICNLIIEKLKNFDF